jgi:putative endonuclease
VVEVASSNRSTGQEGEDRAAAWYEANGYEVVARNWRCAYGEVDLICRRGSVLVICEVKARTSDRFGTPAEAVTRERQRRLRRTGADFAARGSAGARWTVIRFDVAEVRGSCVSVIEAAF